LQETYVGKKLKPKLEKKIIETAKNVLQAEAEAILSLKNTIDDSLENVVACLLARSGRLVITGIGKSALIAQKIVATLNSTGQPAAFLHAADALHGDLGLICEADVLMCISKSGNTPEIKALIPLLKRLGNPLIAMVSDQHSYLALQSDFLLYLPMEREACPLNLAPTTSTTLALAMGDALAMCLLEARQFSSEDFAKFHPGGSLGKRLYLTVQDIYNPAQLPKVYPHSKIEEVILEITSQRLGATAVVSDQHELLGIITDGDLRRMLNQHPNFSQLVAQDIMTTAPKTIEATAYAAEARQIMEQHSISVLCVMEERKLTGFIHLHDLLKEGIV